MWLTWPFGAVGAGGLCGMVVARMIWRLFMQDKDA